MKVSKNRKLVCQKKRF